MPPVHANEVDGAVDADLRDIGEDSLQKLLKFGRVHFTRRHLEFPVLDGAQPTDMTLYRNVVWRVSKDQPGGLAVHQFDVGGLVARICANQLVITEHPKVAKPGNYFGLLFRDNVTAVGLRRCGWSLDQKINFCCLKTTDL